MPLHINKEQFWRSNSYNHPALTDEMIAAAEKILAVKLPIELIELLKIQNGGYTKGFGYPTTLKATSWSANHVPLESLSGIVTDPSIKTAFNLLKTPYMTKEWGLPEKHVLLTGEGDWWITLDYRTNDIPGVRWLDVDLKQDIHIADNFETFINGLRPINEFSI